MMGQLGVPLFAMELITPLQDITAVHVTGMHVQCRQTHIHKKREKTHINVMHMLFKGSKNACLVGGTFRGGIGTILDQRPP